jgi:hypothetical protein
MARPSSTPPNGDTALKPAKAKKVRWYRQLWQAYRMTQKFDKRTGPILGGIAVAVVAVFALLGAFVFHNVWYWTVMGLPFGLIAALFFLTRRVEVAAYSQIEGQEGASFAALSSIRRGWSFTQEPVAVDPRTHDMVFRGVGRAGVLLVGEGPAPRVSRLIESERKRTARVVGGAPIVVMQMGDGEGQVPLRKLTRKVQRLKPVLTKQEVAEVAKRLTALGGARLPLPKGIDPTRIRPDRKGMRGR